MATHLRVVSVCSANDDDEQAAERAGINYGFLLRVEAGPDRSWTVSLVVSRPSTMKFLRSKCVMCL
jgi:hypothetical protein